MTGPFENLEHEKVKVAPLCKKNAKEVSRRFPGEWSAFLRATVFVPHTLSLIVYEVTCEPESSHSTKIKARQSAVAVYCEVAVVVTHFVGMTPTPIPWWVWSLGA